MNKVLRTGVCAAALTGCYEGALPVDIEDGRGSGSTRSYGTFGTGTGGFVATYRGATAGRGSGYGFAAADEPMALTQAEEDLFDDAAQSWVEIFAATVCAEDQAPGSGVCDDECDSIGAVWTGNVEGMHIYADITAGPTIETDDVDVLDPYTRTTETFECTEEEDCLYGYVVVDSSVTPEPECGCICEVEQGGTGTGSGSGTGSSSGS